MATSQPVPSAPVPRTLPQYGCTFTAAIRRFYSNYAKFSGRASQSEFWWVVLLHILVIIVLFILGLGSFIGLATSLANDESGAAPSGLGIFVLVLAGLYFLAAVVPSLALGCRRLHDANLPGALLLLLLIPGVNSIAGLVLGFLPSNPLGARFDADGGVQAAQYGLGQAPVNPNAWGAAPSPYQTPYGQPPQTPYGQAPANPYGQAPQSPYGQPPANPYGQAPTGQAAANPYQQPPAV